MHKHPDIPVLLYWNTMQVMVCFYLFISGSELLIERDGGSFLVSVLGRSGGYYGIEKLAAC